MKVTAHVKTGLSALLILGVLAFGAIGSIVSYRYFIHTRAIIRQTIQEAQKQTIAVAKRLDSSMAQLIPLVQKTVETLSTQKLSHEEIIDLLKQKPIEFNGFGVAYLPYKFSPEKRLYAPYYVEKLGKQIVMDVADKYDYTLPKYDWVHTPLKKGAGFIEPYYGPASETIISEYSAPFYDPEDGGKDKKPIGIVVANQSIKHLNHILLNLYGGTSSYWFITSSKGTIINHPRDKWVLEQKTINDIAKKAKNAGIIKYAQQPTPEEYFEPLIYNNEISGDKSWLFSARMPTTNWTIFQVFNIKEVPIEPNYQRKSFFIITSSYLLALLMLILVLALHFGTTTNHAWLVSTFVALILLANVSASWYFTYRYPESHEITSMIRNKKNLYQILEKEKKIYRLLLEEQKPTQNNQEAPLEQEKRKEYIATGIFVSNFRLLSEGQVEVHGFIWQHYFDTTHSHLEPGFILPQATSLKSQQISKRKTKDGTTYIWEITATLDQILDYSRYPFDTKTLNIEIWHKEFRNKVTLIPDFDSYAPIIPRTLPGLGSEASLSGWFIDQSYFGYKSANPNTFFGMYSYGPYGIYEFIDKSATPKLHYNVIIQRYITGILLGYLIPLFVIALLLFIILFTGTHAGGFVAFIQFSGIFFGTLIAQNQLRYKVPTQAPAYFEWFFLLMYGMIALVLILATMSALKANFFITRYRDNIISKLLYWPLIFTCMNLLTFYYLY